MKDFAARIGGGRLEKVSVVLSGGDHHQTCIEVSSRAAIRLDDESPVGLDLLDQVIAAQ
jgi:hypothetical protein